MKCTITLSKFVSLFLRVCTLLETFGMITLHNSLTYTTKAWTFEDILCRIHTYFIFHLVKVAYFEG